MPRRDGNKAFYEGRNRKRRHGLPKRLKMKRRKYLKRKEEHDRLKRLHNPAYQARPFNFNPKKGKGGSNHPTRKDSHQASGRYNERRKRGAEQSNSNRG